MKIALGLYGVVGAADMALGATYLSAQQFMSYHAQAVGVSWQGLDEGVQILILALMKLAGGAWFALGSLTIIVVLAATKKSNIAARWILPVASFISWTASFAATWGVHRTTGASTPWGPSLLMIGFVLLAFALDAPWTAAFSILPKGLTRGRKIKKN